MFNDIVNSPIRKNHDISSLSYAIVGGSPATPALVRQAESELGCVMSVGYGMTENTCGTFLTALGDVPEITTKTVGHPIPGCEGKIINPETEEILEEGEIGELCTRGFMVFQGYVGEPEKTAESYTKDGWWKTGDLAVIENGVTRITGRSKDMIIRGGENIQPREIENYICSMDQVQDCYVIGVPSKRLGEEVAAYVKLTEEASSSSSISVDEVLEYAKTGLARFKVPKYLKFTESFPQTVTGKIKKFELRKQAMTDFPELADEL
jgi:fatty-acyl-CoA synthase